MDYVEDFYCEKCERVMVFDGELVLFLTIEILKRSDYPQKKKVRLVCRCGTDYIITDTALNSFLYDIKSNWKLYQSCLNKQGHISNKKKKHGEFYDAKKVAEENKKADESIRKWNERTRNAINKRVPGSYGSKQ